MKRVINMVAKTCKKADKTEKKKISPKKFIIILSSVVAFLLVMASVLYIFRGDILMAIAPKEYAAYCMSRTASQLKGDGADLVDTLVGFDIEKKTDFTFSNRLDIAKADVPYESMELAYVPSRNGTSVQLKGVKVYNEKVDMDVLWNDKIIGAGVEELSDDQYYAVSSKNFGKQLADTKLPISKDIKENKNLYDTDLSFSNIMGEANDDKDSFEELKDALKDETLIFLKKGTVEKKATGKKVINGSEKSTHILSLSFKGNDVKEYLLKCIDVASADKEFTGRFGGSALSGLEETIKQGNYDYVAYIDIALYDDRVVSFLCKTGKNLIEFGFDNTECLLNGIGVSYASEHKVFDLIAKGNIKPAREKISYNLSINSDDAYTNIDINMDFSKGKAKFVAEFPDVEKMTLEGTCSMGNGFEFSVKGEESSIELALKKGGKLAKLSGEEYMLLEKSTPSLLWNFGKLVFKSPEARTIIIGFAKEAFEDTDIINSLLNSDGGLGALFGF